jgi:hypothetical protein
MPFTKGKSGNPAGRPKRGAALTDILSYKLDQKTDGGKLRREVIADKLIELAEAGDLPALRYLFDRMDGRPKETISINEADIESALAAAFNSTQEPEIETGEETK